MKIREKKIIQLIFFSLGIPFCAHAIQVWESSHYLWNFGLISASDKGLIKDPRKYFLHEPTFDKSLYQNIKTGDIVWLKCCFVPRFCREILPALTTPIVLLIADGDDSFPSNCDKNFDIQALINSPFITHVFAQNCDYHGANDKITHIPIGMDFHTIAYKGNGGWGEKGSVKEQEIVLDKILKTLKPTYSRKRTAFVDFQHSDSMRSEQFKRYLQFGEDRTSIFKRLLPTGLIQYGPRMRRSQLWATKGEHAFSISPHGNGLDCHRTWEDLVLGCIVIVKTSPLDPLYAGLPVVIVKDWNEITRENFDKWLIQYGDAFTNPEYRKKLTCDYWFSKIQEKARLCRGTKNGDNA